MKLTMKTALAQVLAPQLQESLLLLAAPILEVKSKINSELERNPVLEVNEDSSSGMAPEKASQHSTDSEVPAPSPRISELSQPRPSADESFDTYGKRMQEMIEQNTSWKDYFEQGGADSYTPSYSDEEKRQYFFDSQTGEQSLQEFLREQADSLDLPQSEKDTLELLIGYVDDHGYLRSKPAELAFATNRSPAEIKKALNTLHTSFDPPGVGAYNLRECLLIQIERQGKKGSLEWRIVDSCLEDLAGKRFAKLSRKLGVALGEIQEASARIGLLEPKPGRPFFVGTNIYVAPEVFVKKEGSRYIVLMNDDLLPKLKINKIYKEMVGTDNSPETRSYIRDKIREGRSFITSLEQRQRTIRKIAEAIVSFQRDFMEEGTAGLKPLTMAQVAAVTGVHETTVSRAVSGKYMETPHGVFEMRYFFSAGLRNDQGENISCTRIKLALEKMVASEDKKKPLSDVEIVELFHKKGVNVARRTVAKYRIELGILPSPLRRAF